LPHNLNTLRYTSSVSSEGALLYWPSTSSKFPSPISRIATNV
jgi:hypothetical protein